MADEPDDTDPGTEAAVTWRDWRAELADATGARPDDSSAAPPARSPLPASWDPGAGTADPHLRAHARPMVTPTVEPADEPAGAQLPQRLIEALATVIGRRLDGIDARLHALAAPDGPAGEPTGGAVGAERLEAPGVEPVRTAPPPVVVRLDALAAGIERVASAAAVADLTAAVAALAVDVAGLERRLGELVPPVGAATVEDVLDRLRLLEPPAGAATAADGLDRLNLLERRTSSMPFRVSTTPRRRCWSDWTPWPQVWSGSRPPSRWPT